MRAYLTAPLRSVSQVKGSGPSSLAPRKAATLGAKDLDEDEGAAPGGRPLHQGCHIRGLVVVKGLQDLHCALKWLSASFLDLEPTRSWRSLAALLRIVQMACG